MAASEPRRDVEEEEKGKAQAAADSLSYAHLVPARL